MKIGERLLKTLFVIIYIGIIIAGFYYENPVMDRRRILLIISILLGFMTLVQSFFSTQEMTTKKKTVISVIITSILVLLIALLEVYSKYAIDYFYHTLYIVTIIFVLMYYEKKVGVIIAIATTIISYIKFIQMLYIQPNVGNASLFIFYLVIQILVLIIAIVARNYHEESQKTKHIYLQLLNTYKQLEASSKEVEQLTMEKERTSIARDLHDTLGHDMTGLIMQIEMGTRFINGGQQSEGLELLESAKKSARDSMAKVRQIVQALKTGEMEEWSVTSIQRLIDTFSEKTGVHVALDIVGEHAINPDISIVLYRLIQEGLTNSVRHGKATKVDIDIHFKENNLSLSLKDNGIGCKKLKKGNGIKGMEERLKQLGGSLEITLASGFCVKAKIPY